LPSSGPSVAFRRTALLGTSALVGVGLYLGSHPPSSSTSQAVGDLSILAFSLIATIGCARAARPRTPLRGGWIFLTAATVLWTLGELTYTLFGLTRNHVYPFPSLADVWFLGYAIPLIGGLLAFPRVRDRAPAKSRLMR